MSATPKAPTPMASPRVSLEPRTSSTMFGCPPPAARLSAAIMAGSTPWVGLCSSLAARSARDLGLPGEGTLGRSGATVGPYLRSRSSKQ